MRKCMIDLDGQLNTEHLFMENRVCRGCGNEKCLLADFYRCRKDVTLISSYSYECKACAKKRVLGNYHNTLVGVCVICKSDNVKLQIDTCSKCNRVLKIVDNNLQTLKNMIKYVEDKTPNEKNL